MSYSISEVAKRYGLSVHALRYYDKEGLLSFVARNDAGVRVFEDADFEWLNIICCLRSTGMPLKQIKQFVDWAMEGDTTLETRLRFIEAHTKHVERQIHDLKRHLSTLHYKTWYYQTAVAAGTAAIHGPDSREIFDRLMKQQAED